MTTDTTVRVGVPTWQLDPAHSAVEFSVKHMMMTTVRGRFKELTATLTGDRDHPEAAGVQATIDVGSVDTGVGDRDAHLRSGDFFDAERFPQITFRSTRLDGGPPKQEGDHFRLVGDLTIRDSTMEVVLDCEYGGRGTDPWVRSAKCEVRSAECEVRRAECGVRSAECGVRSAECEVRSAECGVRSA